MKIVTESRWLVTDPWEREEEEFETFKDFVDFYKFEKSDLLDSTTERLFRILEPSNWRELVEAL